MIKNHSITGGNHRHGYTATGSTSGSQSTYDTGSGVTRTNYTHYSGDLTLTYGNATDNPETRPANFTIKIWKRTS